MSAKWSVWDIARANFKTYSNAITGKPMASDYIAFLVIPAGLAIACGIAAKTGHFHLTNVSQFIGGVGIFTGLLFGLLTNVFTLSLKVRRDEGLEPDHLAIRQVRELFSNIGWSVTVGLALIVSVVSAAATHKSTDPLGAIWVGFLTFLFSHLIMTVLMALKRLWFAHESISKLPPKS
ncbi:hypothetical protein [Kitasatospora fiedleri]|uniref:hypothetical protein n=1 Tax=Kitasatospora fiedleri TaxID=2991545 RepID=UPI00249C4350|nr:hypothetical protein [Kitasatospora fiedleri]